MSKLYDSVKSILNKAGVQGSVVDQVLAEIQAAEPVYENQKVATHAGICKEINNLYARKNHDYGDSFAKVRSLKPDACVVRFIDKVLRIDTLLSGAEQRVNDESIDDSLMDLANYAIMELTERKLERAMENEDASVI